MWPWGHLAVGYLLYSLGVHLLARRSPDGYATVALAFGTQFPDLVDKPLAWTFGVLPNGRSLTHSLFVALVLITVVQLLLRWRGYGGVATAFSVGYLAHLLGDAIYPVLAGDYRSLAFLAWPLVPALDYSTEPSFSAHLRKLTLDSGVAAELGFGLLVLLLWLADGAPGLGVVTAVPRWVGRKLSA